MRKLLLGLLTTLLISIQVAPAGIALGGNYSHVIDATTSGMTHFEITPPGDDQGGSKAITNTIRSVVRNIILPLVLFLGIAQGMFVFYSMITSTSDDAKKKGMNTILRGVVGIIVIVSSIFVANTLVGGGGLETLFTDGSGNVLSGTEIAHNLYKDILYPFIRFVMYFIMAGLFLVALVRAINMLFSNKEDGVKQVGTIIKRNAFGLLIIFFSKQIIEAIYGKEQEVLNHRATNIGTIGSQIDTSVPFLYSVINYVMGFIGLFILVIIIIQAVQLLTKPRDEAMQTKLRKNIIYIAIGLALMGVSYVVANFLIIR